MYLTFAGLSTDALKAAGGVRRKLPRRVQGQVRHRPATARTRCTACRPLQVILAAIEKSDGTRKGVRDQVFSGDGITIPADQAVIGKDDQDRPRHRRRQRQGHLGRARQGRQGDLLQGAAVG